MDSPDLESPDSQPASVEPEPEPQPLAVLEQTALDAAALVEEMIEAGEWPEPRLLEQIVSAGDAAVEPLIALLSTDPRGWPEEAPLANAVGLLSVLRAPTAIPALVAVAKRYHEDTTEEVADALVRFGSPGLDALVELCGDPSITGYQRAIFSHAATSAAGDDPLRRSRLAEVFRTMLEDRIAKAREELRQNGFLKKNPPDEDFSDEDDEFDELDDEEEDPIDEDDELDEEDLDDVAGLEGDEFAGVEPDFDTPFDADELDDDFNDLDEDEHELPVEPYVAEEVGFIVADLANLADPLAMHLIEIAFQEGLVDETIVDRKTVDKSYAATAEPLDEDDDWLSMYKEGYESHIEQLRRLPLPRIARPESHYENQHGYKDIEGPPDPPVTVPIRNAGPKLGRNDPCWCGSGRKYKKCHLGKDTLT
jgi:hypothetical protein